VFDELAGLTRAHGRSLRRHRCRGDATPRPRARQRANVPAGRAGDCGSAPSMPAQPRALHSARRRAQPRPFLALRRQSSRSGGRNSSGGSGGSGGPTSSTITALSSAGTTVRGPSTLLRTLAIPVSNVPVEAPPAHRGPPDDQMRPARAQVRRRTVPARAEPVRTRR
jgi:hypothetical protein